MEEEIQSLARFPSENPNPVLRITKDGVVIYGNYAAESLLREWKSEVGSAALDQWKCLVSESLQSGLSKEVEIAHGDQMISFMLAPVMDVGYVNIYGRDVTERKKMEEELKTHASSLEALVDEKSGELLDAERMVTAGKIASMVGHDLRGPLQAINNALYLMKDTPEKTKEAQEIIKRAVQRATARRRVQ